MRKLTSKESAFISEYLKDLNATQAAIRAGYSEKTAGSIGNENLNKPEIQTELFKHLEARAKKAGISQERIVLELARIAFSNMKGFARWDANGIGLRESDELSDEESACVQEISEVVNDRGGRSKLKLYDKIKALELLGKHIGMFRPVPEEIEQERALANKDKFPSMTKEQAEKLLKEKLK